MANRIIAFLVVMASVMALGIAHGRRTDRWGMSAAVSLAAGRLDNIPVEVASWVGEDREIPLRQIEAASAEGYLLRTYTNSQTNEHVQVMILCGRPGPISVHPPTVCFVGAGVRQATPVANTTFSTGETVSEFRTADFVRADVFESAQRTYWAWSPTGESWSTPEGDPRLTFGREPYLYKMYFTAPVERQVGTDEFEPTSEDVKVFIEAMIEVLADHLPSDEA